jgi:hypothetical protein
MKKPLIFSASVLTRQCSSIMYGTFNVTWKISLSSVSAEGADTVSGRCEFFKALCVHDNWSAPNQEVTHHIGDQLTNTFTIAFYNNRCHSVNENHIDFVFQTLGFIISFPFEAMLSVRPVFPIW